MGYNFFVPDRLVCSGRDDVVAVGGLVTMPAINDNIHDILICLIGSSFSSGNTDTEMRSIKTSLSSHLYF
jgi:hypothetical protein